MKTTQKLILFLYLFNNRMIQSSDTNNSSDSINTQSEKIMSANQNNTSASDNQNEIQDNNTPSTKKEETNTNPALNQPTLQETINNMNEEKHIMQESLPQSVIKQIEDYAQNTENQFAWGRLLKTGSLAIVGTIISYYTTKYVLNQFKKKEGIPTDAEMKKIFKNIEKKGISEQELQKIYIDVNKQASKNKETGDIVKNIKKRWQNKKLNQHEI